MLILLARKESTIPWEAHPTLVPAPPHLLLEDIERAGRTDCLLLSPDKASSTRSENIFPPKVDYKPYIKAD